MIMGLAVTLSVRCTSPPRKCHRNARHSFGGLQTADDIWVALEMPAPTVSTPHVQTSPVLNSTHTTTARCSLVKNLGTYMYEATIAYSIHQSGPRCTSTLGPEGREKRDRRGHSRAEHGLRYYGTCGYLSPRKAEAPDPGVLDRHSCAVPNLWKACLSCLCASVVLPSFPPELPPSRNHALYTSLSSVFLYFASPFISILSADLSELALAGLGTGPQTRPSFDEFCTRLYATFESSKIYNNSTTSQPNLAPLNRAEFPDTKRPRGPPSAPIHLSSCIIFSRFPTNRA